MIKMINFSLNICKWLVPSDIQKNKRSYNLSVDCINAVFMLFFLTISASVCLSISVLWACSWNESTDWLIDCWFITLFFHKQKLSTRAQIAYLLRALQYWPRRLKKRHYTYYLQETWCIVQRCAGGLTVWDWYQDPQFQDQDWGIHQSTWDETETETLHSETEAKIEMSTALETKPETSALGDIWQNLHC